MAVAKYPQPTTKKELQKLGLVGYYRSFCKNFSTVVFPLTELLKAKEKFVWSAECQLAFESVKYVLCSSPVLAAPCFEVDASQVGAGAVLLQSDDQGVVRPVSFFSKKFNNYLQNYFVIENEALSLIWALQHFSVYVGVGRPTVVYTDHNPLTFLHSLRCPNQRLMRWALFLQAYNLDIKHIKDADNIIADALSRAPQCQCELSLRHYLILFYSTVVALPVFLICFSGAKLLRKGGPSYSRSIQEEEEGVFIYFCFVCFQ